MNFAQFVLTNLRNAWILEDKGLSLYVRKTPPQFGRGDYDLANMVNPFPRQGSLKLFLDRWESKCQFYVENILNERLEDFFLRRGYAVTSKTGESLCMLSPWPSKAAI